MSISVFVSRLPHGNDLPLPAYETPLSAGLDLRAALAVDVIIPSGQWKLIPTGLRIALPDGYEAQIRSRSGLSVKHGVVVLNAPGTIDADYRGEVQIILANFGPTPFTISHGMRIAQMVVAQHASLSWSIVDDLDTTERHDGGFGSTGV